MARPQSDPDVEQIMNAQLMDPEMNQPEPEPEPTRWARDARHYFRTDHGNRSRSIRIPRPVVNHPNDPDGKKAGFYQRKFNDKYTPEQQARFERVIAANHDSDYIQFKPIPNRFEGFFETDNDELGEYVDELIATGQLPFAYRDSGRPHEIVTTMPTHRAAAAFRVEEARKAS